MTICCVNKIKMNISAWIIQKKSISILYLSLYWNNRCSFSRAMISLWCGKFFKLMAHPIHSGLFDEDNCAFFLHNYRSHFPAPWPSHRFVFTWCSGLSGCQGLLYSSVADNHTLLRMEKWRLIDFTVIPMERQWMCHQFNPLFNGSNLVCKCSLN